jgi:hypothetical protein
MAGRRQTPCACAYLQASKLDVFRKQQQKRNSQSLTATAWLATHQQLAAEQ